jgi:hypothetical protein
MLSTSKKLNIICDSISEAETIAAYETSKTTIFFRQVLSDLGMPQKWPTPVFTDSQSTLDIIRNRKSGRSKHWDVRLRKLYEYADSGQIVYLHIPTKFNLSDYSCNPAKMSTARFKKLTQVLTNSQEPRKGSVSEFQKNVWRYLRDKILASLDQYESYKNKINPRARN